MILGILLHSCKSFQESFETLKISKELGCSGEMVGYWASTEYSEINKFNKFLLLEVDCPNLLKSFDSLTLKKIAAYKFYTILDSIDKKENQAIQVIFKNESQSQEYISNFFKMDYLQNIHSSEILVRDYFNALVNKDTLYIEKQFDKNDLGWRKAKLDSVHQSILKITKEQLLESTLYDWRIVNNENKTYKLLRFDTHQKKKHNIKIELMLRDTLKLDKNIVNITFEKKTVPNNK